MSFWEWFQVLLSFWTLSWLTGATLLKTLGIWRTLPPAFKAALPVAPSFLISPALVFILGHIFPVGSFWITLLLLLLFAPLWFLTPEQFRTFRWDISRQDKWILLGFMVWIALTTILKFFQDTSVPLFPAIGDFPKHQGITLALAGKTLPPLNPFFGPPGEFPLSYYYLFHLLPASVMKTGGLSIGNIFGLISTLTAFGTMATIFLWNKSTGNPNRLFILTGIFLLFFGAPDLIFIFNQNSEAFESCTHSAWSCWWSSMPIFTTAWTGATQKVQHLLYAASWVPHHLNAVSGLFLFPALVRLCHFHKSRLFLLWTPLLVLSIFGSSIYVGLTGLALLLIFFALKRTAGSLPLKKLFTPHVIFSTLSSAALLVWFALEIRPRHETSTASFVLSWFRSSVFFGENSSFFLKFADGFLLLLWGLSPILVLLLIFARRRRFWRDVDRWILTMFLGSLVLAAFVRSTGHYNDFGTHALFITWVSGALLASKAFLNHTGKVPAWQIALVAPILIFSFLGPFHDHYALGPYRMDIQKNELSAKNRDFIQAALFLKENTEQDAVVQSPVEKMSYLTFFSNRRSAILDYFHGSLLNVPSGLFNKLNQAITNIFTYLHDPRAPVATAELGIDYLFIPSAKLPKSIPEGFEMIYRNDHYGIYRVDVSTTSVNGP